MAKNKKPRKKYCAKRPLQLTENIQYWLPINVQIAVQSGSYAVAAASKDYLSEPLTQAILQPVREAIDALKDGTLGFIGFWNLLQGNYLLAHITSYAVGHQKYRIYAKHVEYGEALNDIAVEHFLKPVRESLARCNNEYQTILEAIAQRERRVGKYGASGDELNVLETAYVDLESLTGWCSVSMVYHAAMKCCRNLEQIENSLRCKTKHLINASAAVAAGQASIGVRK